MRSMPESSSAHRTISCVGSVSNVVFSARSSGSEMRVCTGETLRRGPRSIPRVRGAFPGRRASVSWGSIRRAIPPANPTEATRGMTTNDTIAPHGGTLREPAGRRRRGGDARPAGRQPAEDRRQRARARPGAPDGRRPLAPHRLPGRARPPGSILETMHLEDGLPWSIPVTLSLDEDEVKRIGAPRPWPCSRRRRLPDRGHRGDRDLQARPPGRRRSACSGPRTEHPGVKALHEAGDFCVAGPVRAIRLPEHDDFLAYRSDFAQTRAVFRERGWRTVVGFQTRNPIHRAHEYIQKCALRDRRRLPVHPLMGATKGDDVPADVRMQCYEALFAGTTPRTARRSASFLPRRGTPGRVRRSGTRDLPQELRVHPLHRRSPTTPASEPTTAPTTPGGDLRGVRARRAGHHAADVRASLLVCDCEGMASPKTCPHGEEARVSLGHAGARDAARGRAPTDRILAARGRRHPHRGDEGVAPVPGIVRVCPGRGGSGSLANGL